MVSLFQIGMAVIGVALLVLAVVILFRLPKGGSEGSGALLREEFRASRAEAAEQARALREEIASSHAKANEALTNSLSALGASQSEQLKRLTEATEARLEGVRKAIDERLGASEEAQERRGADLRGAFGELAERLTREFTGQRELIAKELTAVRETLRQEQERSREQLDKRMGALQESNEKKLEQMRQTVDEQLQGTLEKRLGESFKLVSERLEAVQRGLGEMQQLANGVGDLKRVLTNVKDRGTWGEYQLQEILEQILTPAQYDRNVATKKGSERVEFAVKMPGKGGEDGSPVWLPIDSKFPKEDYERLLAAAEQADSEGVKASVRALAVSVKKAAKDIHDKYISPPDTTDFAVMFLPTEGLYAEVLRSPGLHDELQREYRVLAAGPTTLSALLTSLKVGFQTLAIERQAHEVWSVLGAVKGEFGKFGDLLERVQKQVGTVGKTIEEASRKTRTIERKLKKVQELPPGEASAILALPEEAEDAADSSEEGAEGGDSPSDEETPES